MFAGQRMKGDSCNDVMQFDVDSNTIANAVQQTTTAITVASSATTLPSSSPSDHANMEKAFGHCLGAGDTNKSEVYVLSVRNDLWIYSTTSNEFSLIYKSSQQPNTQFMTQNAHMISLNQTLFIFKTDSSVHSIQLHKPSRENVFNYCKYLIRKQKYEEITRFDPLSALKFLRNDLSEAIDRSDQNQLNDFHKLASLLFCENKSTIKPSSESNDEEHVASTSCLQGAASSKIRNQRSILFNKLTSLLPKSKRQPQESLLNFINI